MQDITKRLKPCLKMHIYCLQLHVHARIHQSIKQISFFMVSFLILPRDHFLGILKQYYSPQVQFILLSNPLDFISGIVQQN